MASTRNGIAPTRPYRPAITSNRSADRSPLTPRLAASATVTTPSAGATRKIPANGLRLGLSHDSTRDDDGFESDNITPRSAKRRSRVESSNVTPVQTSSAYEATRAQTVSPQTTASVRSDGSGLFSAGKVSNARSPLSDAGSNAVFPAFARSPLGSAVGSTDTDESRFFHASDVNKVHVDVRRIEVKKPAAFFYADGQQAVQPQQAMRTASPPISENGVPSQWQRLPSESPYPSNSAAAAAARSPPMLSPALSAISSSSPFFATGNQAAAAHKPRSPSPSKESVHLSYRKGASQIFGSRPSPIPSPRPAFDQQPERRPSFQRAIASHRKSPSLSSIDSGLSHNSRRRSDGIGSSPLRDSEETQSPKSPPLSKPPPVFPIIETMTDAPSPTSKEGTASPTRSVSELAADARRERKVLDLEISNSSLLAINSSLEREIRRQKIELKRFRRLSRAGRFSFAPLDGDRSSLGTVSEDGTDAADTDFSAFGPASGLSELYEDMSDSDDESSNPTSVDGRSDFRHDRLAKDDQKLRADLEKHKELLVQSQMMNQSLRRCTYATEEMIKDGRRALEYTVRVSDIKLGGRVLTGLDEEDEDGQPVHQIEIEDEFEPALASPMSPPDGIEDNAQGFIDLWSGVGGKTAIDQWPKAGRTSLEESEGGDRDSGIEVDKPSLTTPL